LILAFVFAFSFNFAHGTETCWTRDGRPTLVAEDVAYQRGADSQKLDIYVPSNVSPPYKTILSIHGGCFQWGSKNAREDMDYIQRFTSAGYAVVSVNYRLADPNNANSVRRNLFPAAWEDVQDAARWLRLNGANYKLQTDRFIAFGYSAGATLASYLGTRQIQGSVERQDARPARDPELSPRVTAVIDFSGRTDFLHARRGEQHDNEGRDCAEEFLGENRDPADLPDFDNASVLTGVNASATQFLILHGTSDNNVSIEHSELLYTKLLQTSLLGEEERERKFQFYKIGGADHMFTRKRDMDRAWTHVCPFLTEVLGQPNPIRTARAAGTGADK